MGHASLRDSGFILFVGVIVSVIMNLIKVLYLHRPFRLKMNELLKEMLKLDPTERMTFPQFFDTVDDIITSKIEIVNLLHGTSHKIINDPNLT